MLQQIDAPVTLRPAADVFREEIVATLMDWLYDIQGCLIGGDDRLPKRLIFNALFEKRMLPPGGHGTPLANDLSDLANGKMLGATQVVKRMDWLLQLDSRLWKKAKWQLRQIYCSVVLNDVEARKAFGELFMYRICYRQLT